MRYHKNNLVKTVAATPETSAVAIAVANSDKWEIMKY
jgi:hypothetical protein